MHLLCQTLSSLSALLVCSLSMIIVDKTFRICHHLANQIHSVSDCIYIYFHAYYDDCVYVLCIFCKNSACFGELYFVRSVTLVYHCVL